MDKVQNDCVSYKEMFNDIFAKSSASVKEQFNILKESVECAKCGKCTKLMYTKKIINNPDFESVEGLTLDEAKEIDSEYVDKVLEKSKSEVFFYKCEKKPQTYPSEVLTVLHKDCAYEKWQKMVLDKVNNEIALDINIRLEKILKYRNNFSCNQCGACCRLACSEFDFKRFCEKAKESDKFASEFISTFIPYQSKKDIAKDFAGYMALVEEKSGAADNIHYYYCPKVTEENICSDYENRPQLCRVFPGNPLVILPDSCGYKPWKDEVEIESLVLYALIEISDFYKKSLDAV